MWHPANLADRNHVAGAQSHGWDIRPAAIDREVTMRYQQTRLGTAGCKAQPEDHIIQTGFKDLQEA